MGNVLSAKGKKFDFSVPILVIGAGACGCTAALEAHENGAEVIILERSQTPHGNTSLSGGQIPAGGTKLQSLAGIKDTADILYKDILAKAENKCDKNLVRHVANGSAKTVDWLVDQWQLPLSMYK